MCLVLCFEGDTASDLSSPGGPQSTKPVQVTEANNNSNNNGKYHMVVLYCTSLSNINPTIPSQYF